MSTISSYHGLFYQFSTSCSGTICNGKWDGIFLWPKLTSIEWELGWLSSIYDKQIPWHWRATGEPTHAATLASNGPVHTNQIISQRPALFKSI